MINNLKRLFKGSFFKNIAVLMSGTAIAQGLAFAAAPILSRLYTPESFGLFGLFTAACSILTVIASAKYELAILLPKQDKDAANLLWLSIGIVSIVSICSFFIILIFRSNIAELLGSPALAPLLWWVPATILFSGLYNAFNYWTTRRKQFKRLSISRVIKTTGREGTQLGIGFASNLQGGGLVFGHVIGEACSAGALITQTYREDSLLIKQSFNRHRMYLLAKKHQDFPKYNAPQTFLNSISQNVPAILLAFFFNPAVVGFYWFVHRILFAPNQLIGNSIRQVFYQRVNEKVQEGQNILNIYLKTTLSLAFVGGIPFIVLILFGPTLFSFIFGTEWFEAGRYSQWLCLWWFAGFINPPSVMMIPILGIQRFQLYYEIILAILRVIAISIGGILNNEILSIALFSIIGFILNIYLVIYIYAFTKNKYIKKYLNE